MAQVSQVITVSKNTDKPVILPKLYSFTKTAYFNVVSGNDLRNRSFIFQQRKFQKHNSSFLTAYIAYYTVEFFQIPHTHYQHPYIPELHLELLPWLLLVGILFGLTARMFSTSVHYFSERAKEFISFPPLRPFIGGLIFALAIYFTGATQYLGLGIPTILESFQTAQTGDVFLLKILATAFILGTGFKGGEVTLFFIGATLGSALAVFVPLLLSLLAAMGFVAVFSELLIRQ